MSRALWFIRWHISRAMIHTALKVAPKGPARSLLYAYLNAYGRDVLEQLAENRPS